jgi:hypothetical protein
MELECCFPMAQGRSYQGVNIHSQDLEELARQVNRGKWTRRELYAWLKSRIKDQWHRHMVDVKKGRQ